MNPSTRRPLKSVARTLVMGGVFALIGCADEVHPDSLVGRARGVTAHVLTPDSAAVVEYCVRYVEFMPDKDLVFLGTETKTRVLRRDHLYAVLPGCHSRGQGDTLRHHASVVIGP